MLLLALHTRARKRTSCRACVQRRLTHALAPSCSQGSQGVSQKHVRPKARPGCGSTGGGAAKADTPVCAVAGYAAPQLVRHRPRRAPAPPWLVDQRPPPRPSISCGLCCPATGSHDAATSERTTAKRTALAVPRQRHAHSPCLPVRHRNSALLHLHRLGYWRRGGPCWQEGNDTAGEVVTAVWRDGSGRRPLPPVQADVAAPHGQCSQGDGRSAWYG